MNLNLSDLNLTNIYKRSFAMFCRNIGLVVGKMHLEIVSELEKHEKNLCVMAARGHSKTSIMSVAYSLWLCYKSTKPRYIIIVSMNQTESRRIMGLIRDYISEYSYFFNFKLK